jgi:hypothetical protein
VHLDCAEELTFLMTIQASGRVHLIIIKAMGGGSFMGAQILSVPQIPGKASWTIS